MVNILLHAPVSELHPKEKDENEMQKMLCFFLHAHTFRSQVRSQVRPASHISPTVSLAAFSG